MEHTLLSTSKTLEMEFPQRISLSYLSYSERSNKRGASIAKALVSASTSPSKYANFLMAGLMLIQRREKAPSFSSGSKLRTGKAQRDTRQTLHK